MILQNTIKETWRKWILMLVLENSQTYEQLILGSMYDIFDKLAVGICFCEKLQCT